MSERRPVEQVLSIEQRFADEAKRLRREAQGTPPGIQRDQLLRMARQAEAASHINKWLTSPGLRSPK
jgi:hypothetical protein